MGTLAVIHKALADAGRAWWVAPTYKMSEVGWRPLRQIAAQIPDCQISKSDREVIFPNGGSVTVRSADNPDSLRGEGLDFVVMDECAYTHQDAWTEALRPSLADRQGKALFISTPKGRNWFYDMWIAGEDPEESETHSWQFTSYQNPYIEDSEIDAAKRTSPQSVFAQEFMAEFLADSAGVFRGVDQIMTTTRCRCNAPWNVGCDLAKHQDFTVLVAMCSECGDCSTMDRFNQIDWPLQKARIIGFCGRFKGTLYLDATGIGDPIYDDLQRQGLNVVGVKLTNQSKQTLIQDLILSIEQRKISFPANWDVMANELKRYEYEYTASRNISYNAPSGYHDDCVISLSLANRGRSQTYDILMAV